ncbi:MAG TPA: type IV pilus secretin PilQ [Terriglobales bacterium]|nr:type IV pilus secretin PilQ [Terriglobales bacterium]
MSRVRVLTILGSLLLLSTVAAAAASQLTEVSAATQGNATIVTIRANGAFTHTEYRPAENLLLVDLAGVSAEHMDGKTHTLQVPGVTAYRVVGFRSSTGVEVARVEMTLMPAAGVAVNEAGNTLQVRVTGFAEETKARPAQAPVRAEEIAPKSQPGATVTLQDIQVAQSSEGTQVEIVANAPLAPKAMKLRGPDRLVIDLPNTVATRNSRQIAVNAADVRSVRMGRFKSEPPVTRVVLDLAAAHDYELQTRGNRLLVKLRPVLESPADKPEAPQTAQTAPVTVASGDRPSPVPSAETAPQTAQEVVFVEPKFEPKPEAQTDQANETSARVQQAAAKFGSPPEPIAFSNAVTPASGSLAAQPAVNLALMQQQQMSQAGASATSGTSCVRQARYTGEPISLNLKDADLKDFFRLIHEISGLNVVLDPAVKGSVTVVLDDVPWDQALAIVLKNNNMECELDGNVLRIATLDTLKKEADSRKAQQEAQMLAVPKVTVTRFLSYARAADVTPTIKKFLTQRGDVIADQRTNALIIEDVPAVIPTVDRLIKELDRKTQEVEIEARVVAATRNFARDIGMQIGFGWGNNPTGVGGAGSVGTSPLNVAVSNPLYFTIGNAIPLFSNLPALGPTSGISFSNASQNYRVDAILTMAESRGLLKILSRPRVVTQNNIQAFVKQGVRVPVVTAAQLGGPPTVTYVDAFLRLTVTPQITVENTIFLNVDVENTTPDFSRTVSGNPTLLTSQATTQVLITDGGTVVIGGVIQTQNSINVFQVPLLGNIPIFGELFKRRSVSTSTQELIFFITPKIIQT